MHKNYGAVVRVTPNKLSYANTEVWHDVYSELDTFIFLETLIWWVILRADAVHCKYP